MFGNLVRIELIRLLHNKTLKYGVAIGAFIIFSWVLIIEYLVGFNDIALLDEVPRLSFELVAYTTSFGLSVSAVSMVSVVYTTCEYYRSRIAVNIEGAVRSRLKLCLSEICGIIIFVALLNLLVVPGLVILDIFVPDNIGIDYMITIYGTMTVYTIYSSLIVYFTAKMIKKIIASIMMSMAFGVLMSISLISMNGFMIGLARSGNSSVSNHFISAVFVLLLLIPVIILGTVNAVNYRKADRI